MIEAEMPDGTILEFPQGTDQSVIDKAAKDYIASIPKQQPYAGGIVNTITPEEARRELARRELARRRGGDPQSTTVYKTARQETPEGPWTRYQQPQQATAAPEGPWTRYAASQSASSPRMAASDQLPNIGRKGDMRPDSRVQPNFNSATAQGFFLGGSDELIGGIAAPLQSAVNAMTGEGPTSLSENYQQAAARERSVLAATREAAPMLAGAGEIVGALGTGAASLPAKLTTSLGKRVLARGAEGAAAGGLYGFNSANGSLSDRAEGARMGAGIGGGVGAGLPVVGAVGRTIAAPVVNAVRTATPARTAQAKVVDALMADGLTPDTLRAGMQAAPETVIADLGGESTRRLARGAMTVPHKSQQDVVSTLAERQAGQGERVSAAFGDALGDARAVAGSVDSLVARKQQEAAPLYQRAFQTNQPVNLSPVLSRLDDQVARVGSNTGLGKSLTRFKRILIDPATGRAKQGIEQLHAAKLDIDDTIAAAVRAGEKNKVRLLTEAKAALLDAMDEAAPAYREARAIFADAASSEAAMSTGRQLARNPLAMSADDIAAMPASERDFVRLGFADGLREAIARASDSRDVVTLIAGSPAKRATLRAMFPDAASFDAFEAALKREAAMTATARKVGGGSNTVDKAQDAASIEPGVVLSLLAGDLLGAAKGVAVGAARRVASGTSPRVADEVSRALLTRGTQKQQDAIAKAMVNRARKQDRNAAAGGAVARALGLTGSLEVQP